MLRLLAVALLCLAGRGFAHDGLDVEPPTSEQDAWNALNLCQANIDKLIKGKEWTEIPLQATLCNQSLRYLREHAGAAHANLMPKFLEAEETVLQLFRAASQGDWVLTPRLAKTLDTQTKAIAAGYDPAIAQAIVYSCPMCRGVHELDPKKTCFKCGMKLVPRIIPASSVYNTPGESSIALTAALDHPLSAGTESEITLHFQRKKDGAPISSTDLLVVHTQRIHLLIIDESLLDYHHEHPVPAATAGDYRFHFTPRNPGPYRIFADVVPALSAVQEYAVCDLPGSASGQPMKRVPDSTEAEADGLRYSLEWDAGGVAIRARQPVRATIRIADAATGQPFTKLEPIMGTFAHVVAFHEDRQTVLHIHPMGYIPQSETDRSGPSFTFQFYAPKGGMYRLYSQVQVGGKSRFAPFVVNVTE